jgi:hypothetical protein
MCSNIQKSQLNMKKIFYLYVLSLFILISCEKSEIENELITETTCNQIEESENRSTRPVVLGGRKENPFSLENMKIALDTLKSHVKQDDNGIFKVKSIDELELEATDLYVRFLPLDSVQYKTLKNDTTLTLFDFPLDYEITQNGDYYHDPDLSTQYTWLYTTVKPGYLPAEDIQYEILQELFIPENSEYYTEESISGEPAQSKANKVRSNMFVENHFFQALYVISFALTKNIEELNTTTKQAASTTNDCNPPIMKVTVPNCTRYTIRVGLISYSWTSCDPFYYPDGYIKVKTPNGDIGLKGIKVRMWRWFSYAEARTDANGYYSCSTRFNSILVGNDIDYHIIFDGQNGSNNWTFNRSLFGTVCLWTNYYSAGPKHPSGYSMTFNTDNDYWGRCILNNAVYDYCNIARADGISLPPGNLEIANMRSDNLTSGAPLLNNHINFSLVYAYPNFWGVIAQLYAYQLLGQSYPDLILRFTNSLSDYDIITAIAWHELTHASQLRRMINEKGILWASDYWSANVYQQAKNTIENGRPYGAKGESRWQQIALSEGWANYREELMARSYLSDPDYVGTTNSFLSSYVSMLKRLKSIGCSYTKMELSLCTYSIGGYRDNLISNYPSLRTQITNIIKDYE